jgi:ribose transport system substrate-binding protein
MAALVPGGGSIAVITIPGQRNLDDRVAGLADALKNFPAIKLTKILDDKGDARSAFDQVSELIQKKEKVDGIICLEATGGFWYRRSTAAPKHGRQAADCSLRRRSRDT